MTFRFHGISFSDFPLFGFTNFACDIHLLICQISSLRKSAAIAFASGEVSAILYNLSACFIQGGSGGLSPGKLRNMLLRVENKKKEEEELEHTYSLRSQTSEINDSGILSF